MINDPEIFSLIIEKNLALKKFFEKYFVGDY